MRVSLTAVAMFILSATVQAGDPSAASVRVFSKYGNGSGVAVFVSAGKTLVLTNNHVIGNQPFPGAAFPAVAAGTTAIVRQGNLNHTATVVHANAEADVIFLRVDAVLPTFPLAASPAAVGVDVVHYGDKSGTARGKTLAVTAARRPSESFLSSARSIEGDSGAGVFVGDEVVAIVCGRTHLDPTSPLRGTSCVEIRRAATQAVVDVFPGFVTIPKDVAATPKKVDVIPRVEPGYVLVEQTIDDGRGGTFKRIVQRPVGYVPMTPLPMRPAPNMLEACVGGRCYR